MRIGAHMESQCAQGKDLGYDATALDPVLKHLIPKYFRKSSPDLMEDDKFYE